MITASVFRKLKEVREMGERHGANQEQAAERLGTFSEGPGSRCGIEAFCRHLLLASSRDLIVVAALGLYLS
jgi:hypothetical protein